MPEGSLPLPVLVVWRGPADCGRVVGCRGIGSPPTSLRLFDSPLLVSDGWLPNTLPLPATETGWPKPEVSDHSVWTGAKASLSPGRSFSPKMPEG